MEEIVAEAPPKLENDLEAGEISCRCGKGRIINVSLFECRFVFTHNLIMINYFLTCGVHCGAVLCGVGHKLKLGQLNSLVYRKGRLVFGQPDEDQIVCCVRH